MKDQVRVLGLDDAPFDFEDETVPVVGALMRGRTYLEAVLRTDVEVDGTDATDQLIQTLRESRYADQPKALLLDGVALGGFNVVDVGRLHEATGVPAVTVTRDPPDLDAMRRVLETRFDDWERRWEAIRSGELFEVPTDHKPLHVKAVGIEPDAVAELLGRLTVRGALPEPLRVAHLIAAGIATGESRGRA